MSGRHVCGPDATWCEKMHRLLNLTDLVGACAVGLAVYKFVQLGPYEASLLLGRSLRIFLAAVQGHI